MYVTQNKEQRRVSGINFVLDCNRILLDRDSYTMFTAPGRPNPLFLDLFVDVLVYRLVRLIIPSR
jgi:hypothetical protein